MKISRIDAIKIIDRATDRDDPFWEQVTEDWYDEAKDDLPSIMDVFAALGVTEAEYRKATGADGQLDWPNTEPETAWYKENVTTDEMLDFLSGKQK